MKSARLANAVTETPPRSNSKDKPSKYQQGESKRTKAAGWKNYYDMFNTKGKGEEDAEETGEIEEQSRVFSGGEEAGVDERPSTDQEMKEEIGDVEEPSGVFHFGKEAGSGEKTDAPQDQQVQTKPGARKTGRGSVASKKKGGKGVAARVKPTERGTISTKSILRTPSGATADTSRWLSSGGYAVQGPGCLYPQ
jgi:hypothetical protein